MRWVLDAGALLALERGDRESWRRLKDARLAKRVPLTHGAIVGQVWRGGGPRQALLARALGGIEIVPVDDALGRRAGALLARTGRRDVIDAALVLLAEDGDHILTSDVGDLAALALAAGKDVELVPV